MNNLLYLHGLYAVPMPEKLDALAHKARHVFAPKLDYFEHPDLYGWLLEEIDIYKIDYIVGSSAGGLMGYWLAKQKGLRALLFNPALSKVELRPDILRHTAHIPARDDYFFDIILGEQDDVISPESTRDYLAMHEAPAQYKVHALPALGHRIDLQTFAWALDTALGDSFTAQQP